MRFLRRLWFVLTLRRREDDLAEEMRLHREMAAEAMHARGVSSGEVPAAVQRRLGNDLLAREQSRDVWVPLWLQDITQDITFGARMLIKDRRFTFAAVLALGLGIGLNTSVFTIVNAALFKEVPFDDPTRLVSVQLAGPRGAVPVAPADFLEWRDAITTLEGLGASAMTTLNVSEESKSAERFRAAYLSVNAARLLRVAPIMGRDFREADEQPGAPLVILIGYEAWQGRYGGEPVVGRDVRVNGQPATIAGVMPAGFAFPMIAEAWLPLNLAQMRAAPRGRGSLSVFGRLARDRNLPEARAELTTLASRTAAQAPAQAQPPTLTVTTMKDGMNMRRDAGIFATLLGAVGFVLLIACANVASLLMARASHRAREMAVRASIGASRWRLMRQLLVECGLLAILAAIVGYWLSLAGARQLAAAFRIFEVGAPGGSVMPYWVDLSTDTIVAMFIGGLCLLASLGIGLLPAWQLARTNVNETLKEGGRGAQTPRTRFVSSGLIVAQLSLTLMLLAGAGLLVRSFTRLYFTDLVIDTTGLVAMRVVLPVEKYPTHEHQRKFFTALQERLDATPVFASATLISEVPFMPLGFVLSGVEIRGREPLEGSDLPQAYTVTAGDHLIETLGLAIVKGRALTSVDGAEGQAGVVVNERFVAKFLGGGEALGESLRFTAPGGAAGPWLTIVGVSRTIPSFVQAQQVEPVAYVPLGADARQPRAMSVLARAADTAGMQAVIAAAREQVAALDPDLPLFAIQTLDDAAAMGRSSSRMVGSWFVTIAAIALVLAAVGLYALTAHGVAQRTHEIGVRMALGAQARAVTWLFVRRAVVQLAIGVMLGLIGALAVGRALSALVSGTDPNDPMVLGLAAMLFVAVGLAATLWPARRAARVDPVEALRAD